MVEKEIKKPAIGAYRVHPIAEGYFIVERYNYNLMSGCHAWRNVNDFFFKEFRPFETAIEAEQWILAQLQKEAHIRKEFDKKSKWLNANPPYEVTLDD